MVDDLQEMLVELLELYQKNNQDHLPERVLIFRDGVSEVSTTTGARSLP